MSLRILFAVFLLSTLSWNGQAQKTTWMTETQSEFIDISGLFGLKEPAQVTTMQYVHGGLFVDGFHSFSWREPGMTIQTFFGAGYTFSSDSTRAKTLSIKNDFAYNRVANNASFIRPMVFGKWVVNVHHTFYAVSWVFFDMRKEPVQPLNGGIAYLGYAYTQPWGHIILRNEIRVLFVRILDVRDVFGITDQIKLTHRNSRIHAVVNTGYTVYRSDNVYEFIWNVGLGKTF